MKRKQMPAAMPPLSVLRPLRVAVVVPAYNESDGLSRMLPRVAAALAHLPHDIVGVVVDDGSLDATSIVAREAGWECITHVTNQGFGAAINSGLLATLERADIIVTMDGDDTHEPSCIEALLDAVIRGYDVAIASRYVPGAILRGVPLGRQWISRLANCVARTVIQPGGVRDYSSGYRAFRSDILRDVMRRAPSGALVQERGFAATVELLLAAQTCGASVTEIPIRLFYDRKPTSSAMRVCATIVRGAQVCGRHALGAATLVRPSDTAANGRVSRPTAIS